MTVAVAQQTIPPNTPWWLVLLEGISLLILGLLLLASPGMTTLVVVQFIGIYWLVAGIFRIISIFLDRAKWGWKLAGGLLGIVAGLMVMQHPLWSPYIVGSTVVIILGIQALIFGGIGLVQAVQGGGWGTGILGATSLLFGFLFLTNVFVYTLSLPWAIGILAIIGGIMSIVTAFRLKNQ